MEHKRYIKQTIAFLSLLLLSYCSKELFAQTENSATYLEYLKKGLSKDELKDYTGAIQDYNEAVSKNPEVPQPYLLRRANALK